MTETRMTTTKPWYASKTMWTNIAALGGSLATFFATGETEALAVAVLGLINMVLRMLTGQPIA